VIESFSECGPPLKDRDIVAWEDAMGQALPPDYRDFLLEHNGGRPFPNAFPIEGLDNNPFVAIQVFFRINGKDVESSNLDWNLQVFKDRLPENLLAIACDDGGDLICYSLFGKDVGAIVFWDRHQERDEPTYDNVYPIANSFPKFLEGIRDMQF
jgi:hypothetical protein